MWRAIWWYLDKLSVYVVSDPVVLHSGIYTKENSHSGPHKGMNEPGCFLVFVFFFFPSVICGVRSWRQDLDAYYCERQQLKCGG